MAIGDGVEGAGIKGDAGHKPIYPAPGGPASRAGSTPAWPARPVYLGPLLNRICARDVLCVEMCFTPDYRRNKSPAGRNHFNCWRRYPETYALYQAVNEMGRKGPTTGDRHDQGTFSHSDCRVRLSRAHRI